MSELKGTIPLIPNVFENVQYLDLLNELLTSFGRIKNATSGQVLAYDASEGEYLPSSLSGLTAFSRKIGSFTRNTSLAGGTQAVTGVGFEPQIILFLACQDGSNEISIGFTDGTNNGCIARSASANLYYVSTAYSIRDIESSGATTTTYEGTVAMDSDGFTVTWTKTASPTGTLTVLYLALRIA